jgi:hypothetical protein
LDGIEIIILMEESEGERGLAIGREELGEYLHMRRFRGSNLVGVLTGHFTVTL